MKYYQHRIVNHHGEWSIQLLDNENLLSYGWAAFTTRPGFVKQYQDDWSSVPTVVEEEWGKLPQRFGLQRFLEMERGDWVVVPTSWATFHVYEVADGAPLVPADIERELASLDIWREHDAAIREDGWLVERNETQERQIDLGVFRRVERVEWDIPRKEYADALLRSAMRIPRANVDITRLSQSIQDAIKACRKGRPIVLRNLLKEEFARKVRDAIYRSQDHDQIEKLIESYLTALGASAVIPPKREPGKEGDADIVATFDALKLMVYVQAKRYAGETGKWAVEQIERYRDEKERRELSDEYTHVAWVVSTSDGFSKDCVKRAKDAGVRLINGIEFAEMLLDAGIEHI